MLSLTAKVMNVLFVPAGKRPDGTAYGASFQVQLIAENQTPSGETKMDLINLKTENGEAFRQYLGKDIRVPIGAFARSNAVVFYLPKQVNPAIDIEAA